MHINAEKMNKYAVLGNYAIYLSIMCKLTKKTKRRKCDYTQLSREDIIFIKHFFENGDATEARKTAGIQNAVALRYQLLLKTPGNPYYDFYQELRQDRIASISVTAEKKRRRIWDLVEFLTNRVEEGNTGDALKILACIDILNKMDGHYVPLEVHSKQQIQSVRFDQRIGQARREMEKIVSTQ